MEIESFRCSGNGFSPASGNSVQKSIIYLARFKLEIVSNRETLRPTSLMELADGRTVRICDRSLSCNSRELGKTTSLVRVFTSMCSFFVLFRKGCRAPLFTSSRSSLLTKRFSARWLLGIDYKSCLLIHVFISSIFLSSSIFKRKQLVWIVFQL